MKKLALTLAIVLGLSMTTFAGPHDGGLFQRGATEKSSEMYNRTDPTPFLPGHNSEENGDADQVPMGTGIALLAGLGAAYLIGKRRKED